MTDDAELSRSLARDYTSAKITDADRAMLDYAVKLTRTPSDVGETDIDRLRSVGFEDAAILDICQVTCYYNYVNRLADGLGVQLETDWKRGPLTLTRPEFEALRTEGSA